MSIPISRARFNVFDRRPLRQLDICLPELAHDLLRAVPSPRHSDLPSLTQIVRLHLDPFFEVRSSQFDPVRTMARYTGQDIATMIAA